MTAPSLPGGTWPSPLTAAQVSAASTAYGDVAVTDEGRTVWWAESRPSEGGRTTVLRRTGKGPVEQVLPAGLDARTRVHEYGGRCWLPHGSGLITSNLADQRLWLIGADGSAQALTHETGATDRYAEPTMLPGGTHLLCIREQVGERTTHQLVAVPLDGSAEVTTLWDGSDFVGSPAVAPDGARVAFVTWDHPRMPWDGTELRVADLFPGPVLGEVRTVLGGPEESVQTPAWEGDVLRAVTDRTGWWNLVRLQADDVEPIWPVEQECGWPMWRLGMTSHRTLSGGRTAVVHDGRLAVLEGDGSVTDVDVPFTGWAPSLASDTDVLVGVAWTPSTLPQVVAVDLSQDPASWRVVAGPEQPHPAWAPAPETVEVPSTDGRTTYAHLYPPTSPTARLPEGAGAPYVVLVHGGPTAHVPQRYSALTAYFTSRGIGIADVDYGGSSGYGRAYRELLRGQWGVVDVEDCEAVARWLLESGRATSVAISGGSAGGWTVLCALTRGDSVFGAGTSSYGVADLVPLAEGTHDFESRYLDGLVGPLPAARPVYDERSPLSRVDQLDRPVLLLQGLDDPVVPPAQAERFVAALQDKGVPHAYLAFPGEAHGFRKAETQITALEAELSFYGQVFGFATPGVPLLSLQHGAGSSGQVGAQYDTP